MTRTRWWRLRDQEEGDPPGRVFSGCVVVLALFGVWVTSAPSHGFWEAVALTLGWLLLALGWLVLVGVTLVRSAARRRMRRLWARWLVLPAVVVAVAAGLFADLPLRARFAASEDALRDTAVAVQEGRDPDLGRVGLYEVVDAEAIPGGVLLSVAGEGGDRFRRAGGFAYFPAVRPAPPDSTSFDHLTGPWYIWRTV